MAKKPAFEVVEDEDERPARKLRAGDGIATLLVLVGIIVTFIGATADTKVYAGAGEYVHNIGKVCEKIIFTLGGLLTIGIGVLVAICSSLRRQECK